MVFFVSLACDVGGVPGVHWKTIRSLEAITLIILLRFIFHSQSPRTDNTRIYVVLTSLRDIQYSCLRLDLRMLELNQLRNWLNLVVWSFGSLRFFSNLNDSISVLSSSAYTICRLPTSAKDSSVPLLHSYFWYRYSDIRYSDESAGASAVHVWSADL